jgi:23S rRNA (adenine2503-C2)-methyltransferase
MADALRFALDLEVDDWRSWAESQGFPAYLAQQIRQWLFEKGRFEPMQYSNIARPVREALQRSFRWTLPEVDARLDSDDGSEKFLLKTHDGLFTEMVLMPSPNRITLCISSQVGCRLGCTFCQTGKLGFTRHLSRGEILAQILLANQRLVEKGESRRVSNIVFMGMGEPLDNYDEVVPACRTMIDRRGLGLSRHRVTVSTAGMVPEIERLGQELPVRLAISLHSPDDERRSQLMPINRTYPLARLKEALLRYPCPARYGITFEYVMIQGENDSLRHAKQLVHFVHGLKAKVNLIPLNHFPGSPLKRAEAESIRAFQKYLADRSIPAPVRYSRGQDVSAACGQLAAKRAEELDRDPRDLRRERQRRARKNQSANVT